MLKYVDVMETFSEVPDEISLCINISNCPCHCKGCHSPYLAEDVGEDLTFDKLLYLCYKHNGISCVSFMGGDSDPSYINKLAAVIKESELPIKTAWYSGRQELSDKIDLKNFDYIKLGPYVEEKGPLNNHNTNQKFYEVCRMSKLPPKFVLKDITNKFWK